MAVDCWLAITENRTGPNAYKSQDVVTALNGKTIQTIHTDAEGRMVLADTLTLASREQAKADCRLCDIDRRSHQLDHDPLQRHLHQ